jgi:hypothetical protein
MYSGSAHKGNRGRENMTPDMTGSSQWMQRSPERCGHHIYISHPAIHTWQGNIKTQHPDVKQNIVDHEFQTVNVVTSVKKMFNMQGLQCMGPPSWTRADTSICYILKCRYVKLRDGVWRTYWYSGRLLNLFNCINNVLLYPWSFLYLNFIPVAMALKENLLILFFNPLSRRFSDVSRGAEITPIFMLWYSAIVF